MQEDAATALPRYARLHVVQHVDRTLRVALGRCTYVGRGQPVRRLSGKSTTSLTEPEV